MGFLNKYQKHVKTNWFPNKPAETCKNTWGAETCKNTWVY